MLAFAAIYLVWGSTYLAIKFAIETLPPFLMAGTRFFIAGTLLYAWCRWRGVPRPDRTHWLSAMVVGGLMLAGGNGGVVWAEQRVPSGVAALIVATTPFFMVLLDWWWRGGPRPTRQIVAGLITGFFGVVILVSPAQVVGGGGVDLAGALALMGAGLCWAMGSIFSLRARKPASPLLFTAMAMLAGGTLLLGGATAGGEWAAVHLSAITARSLLALGYLIVFGSLITYSAYVWLLRVSTPARVSTAAYVNPVVAVLLGWLLGGEGLAPRTMLAALVILAAVGLITSARAHPGARPGGPARRAPPGRPSGLAAPAEETPRPAGREAP